MPTVLRFDGLSVVIYPNDGRPAHVRGGEGGECEAVFVLNCPGGPPSLRESYGFSRRILIGLASQLASRVESLCADWESLHGRH